MVAYIDSSVLLKHILQGGEEIRQPLACDAVISSELLRIECNRAIHRYRMEGIIDDEGFIRAINRLGKVLDGISLVEMSSQVKERAVTSFPVHIKTLDALHLSSALAFEQLNPAENLLVFSLDKNMNRCARALGFTVPFYTGLEKL